MPSRRATGAGLRGGSADAARASAPSEWAAPAGDLVERAARGQGDARNALFDLAYPDLLRQAAGLMRRQRSGHTLEPESLVHEAYVRIARAGSAPWAGYGHFLALVHCAMRQTLIDHALRGGRRKRGGGRVRQRLTGLGIAVEDRVADLADVHDAVERLRALDPDAAAVVDLRFFGGLSARETAERMAVSLRTVERDWQFARTWLLGALSP